MKKFKSFSISKKVITIIIVALAILAGYKILDATCYPLVRAKAEIYLCMKYDVKPDEIKLVDHQNAYIYWDDDNIFWLNPEWVDFSFEYTYNDRNFFVNRYKGKFYDDYQLEDLEKWCTEWLQKNVDKKITGLSIYTSSFLNYYCNSDVSSLTIIKKEDTEKFLNAFSYPISKNDDDYYDVFYYDKRYENKNYTYYNDEDDKIESELLAEVDFNSDKLLVFFSNNITKTTNKYDWSSWYHDYFFE